MLYWVDAFVSRETRRRMEWLRRMQIIAAACSLFSYWIPNAIWLFFFLIFFSPCNCLAGLIIICNETRSQYFFFHFYWNSNKNQSHAHTNRGVGIGPGTAINDTKEWMGDVAQQLGFGLRHHAAQKHSARHQRCFVMKHLNKIKYVTHSVSSVIYDGSSDLTLAMRSHDTRKQSEQIRSVFFFFFSSSALLSSISTHSSGSKPRWYGRFFFRCSCLSRLSAPPPSPPPPLLFAQMLVFSTILLLCIWFCASNFPYSGTWMAWNRFDIPNKMKRAHFSVNFIF